MGKFIPLFASSKGISDKEKLIASYTSNEKYNRLLSTIFDNAGMTNMELSRKFKMNKSSTYWYLKKLIDANIIECRWDSRYKKYYMCPDVRHIIVKYLINESYW
ncbi:winged helix-turn-helix domain-containing protein [Methanocella conradii]|uniref:winged helix-turn-helix domain-containing protein n=1 Tax=Methanocella conradii TaxID=1175444 RepID=UPI0024B3234E|nr:winged helix-turn-helix domain-containing protein [Methanocella conradii]MDI6896699.1 winged helix-turn-helix domain-containing protein [Methanocella conradii]